MLFELEVKTHDFQMCCFVETSPTPAPWTIIPVLSGVIFVTHLCRTLVRKAVCFATLLAVDKNDVPVVFVSLRSQRIPIK